MSLTWQDTLRERLALYGHRNWIAVVDSAYPAQSSPGVETLVTGAGQFDAVRETLDLVAAARHVTPVVYVDSELDFVAESDAPGVAAYRQHLRTLLDGLPWRSTPHDEIIALLDQAGRAFRVLILKTDMTIPYTSVFLHLECAYWNAAAEGRLRAALACEEAKHE